MVHVDVGEYRKMQSNCNYVTMIVAWLLQRASVLELQTLVRIAIAIETRAAALALW